MEKDLTDDAARRRRHRNERIAAAALVALAAVVTFLLWRRDVTERRELAQDKRYIPQQFVMTREVELLQQYLRIDTSNPPGRELAGAQWLAAQLRAAGIPSEIIESSPGRANLYARIRGREPGKGLLLLNHIDVVPATKDGWRRAPFSGDVFLDSVYGRGAIDMKGVAICQLSAFIAAARRGTPKHDLVFLAVADEEQGSTYGVRWLLEHRADVFDGIGFALNEGGITEMSADRVNYFGIEIGSKGRALMKARASTPEALRQLRIDLEPFYGSRVPEVILPEVEAFFRDVAPQRIQYRAELSDIRRGIAAGRFWAIPSGYRELTQNVIFADRIVASGGAWEMVVRIYTIPTMSPDASVSRVRQLAAKRGVTTETTLLDAPYPLSPRATPLFDLLASSAKQRWKTDVGTEILTTSFNDSRFLRQRGIVAYGINPFPVDYFQSLGVHASDERVTIPRFQEGVQFLTDVVGGYLFESRPSPEARP